MGPPVRDHTGDLHVLYHQAIGVDSILLRFGLYDVLYIHSRNMGFIGTTQTMGITKREPQLVAEEWT